MQEKIITIYCLCDDFFAANGFRDDPQAQSEHRRGHDRRCGGCYLPRGQPAVEPLLPLRARLHQDHAQQKSAQPQITCPARYSLAGTLCSAGRD